MKVKPERLIKRSLAGEIRAFKQLINMYHSRIFDLCFRMAGNKTAAQDQVVRTFVAARQRLGEYDFSLPFHVWLYSLAVSCSVQTGIEEDRTGEPSDAVEEMLGHVPFYPRIAMILKYAHRLTPEETAYVLNCRVETIKSYLRQGRELLRIQQRSNITKPDLLLGI
ncbi:sigma factor-like helix-turn-helix DNA-binding protein [Paenibacillus sp. TH7-28]